MNRRSKFIIEEASSGGIWDWLEFDINSNSLYLEFIRFKLSSKAILWPGTYRGELAIRFGGNIYLSVFYNDSVDLGFLNLDDALLKELLGSDLKLTNRFNNFYRDFSYKISDLKISDSDFTSHLSEEFTKEKVLIGDCKDNYSFDYFLSFICDKIAIVVGGDSIICFNDYESLDDNDIIRISNNWVLYYLDYWNKKGSLKEYDRDILCEEHPLK